MKFMARILIFHMNILMNVINIKGLYMMKMIILVFLLFFSGCTAKFEDISSSEEYSKIFNKKYRTLIPLKINGIYSGNGKKKVDTYIINKFPGSSGPELIDKQTIEAGTIVKINKVVRCINCFAFPKTISFIVNISKKVKEEVPIRLINLSILGDDGKHFILDPTIFKEIEK